MRHVRAWLRRLAGILDRDRQDRELEAEIESHLQMHVDDNLRAGMTPAAARRDAVIRLGGVEQVKQQYRDRRRVPVLEPLVQDVRFGLRVLRRTPTFTAVAILTLGLGIGANTAIFSVVNAVLLRPLPFPDSHRLVQIWATDSKRGATHDVASYPDFEAWNIRSRSFDGMAAFTTRSMTLAGGDQANLVPALQVSPGFFETLGVSVANGRGLRADDGVPGAPRVAVLSDTAWKRYFGGRADVLGQTIRANEEPYTVVGVMPAGFAWLPGEGEQIYAALPPDPSRSHGFLRIVARLRAGVELRKAQAEMTIIAAQIAKEFPRSNQNVGTDIVPLVDGMVGGARDALLIFLGVVAFVLLIACTNVANLTLARNATREKELSLRTALGAGRRRLIQQLLTESVVLALAGGVLGLLLAHWGTRSLIALIGGSASIPRINEAHSDGRVLAFTLALSVATGILFGVVPALVAGAPNLVETLRESSRSATAGGRSRRARAILMIAETALALVLLAGSGMLLKNLMVLRATAPGFDTRNMMAVEFWMPKKKFAQPAARARFFDEVLTRVRTVPGVRAAALVANLPLNGGSDSLGFQVTRHPSAKMRSANFNVISAGYFRTMAIPLIAGREFAAADHAGTLPVIVVNAAAARAFWPGEDPLGQQITLPTDDASVTLTVVGVTGDVRQMALGAAPQPEIFLDCLQPGPNWPWLVLVARTDGDPMNYATSLKAIARNVDPDVPISLMRSVDDVLARSLAQPRVYAMLLGVFASLALLLAAVGLYGVVSYNVAQRTHEIGIRMALGARRGDMVRLVLRQGAVYTLAGIALGAGGAIAFMRLLATLMPTAEPRDLTLLGGVSALLMMVALAASYVPARRGSRVDPIVALRAE